MAMYRVQLSSIKEVARHYDSIKPINSAKHRGKDTRPIADRARNWETVVKYSDDHYALRLMDGWNGATYKPIEWVGDTCVIRNGTGDSAHNSHYSFLERFLPRGMSLIIRSGKQFIRVGKANSFSDTDFYLPKVHNNEFLTFKLGDYNEWVMQHAPYVVPRVRVDKEKKAKYKKEIAEFTEWAWTILPLLDGQYTASYTESRDRCRQAGITCYWAEGNSDKFLKVLSDPNNEHRLSIVCEYMCQVEKSTKATWDRAQNMWVYPKLFTDPKKFRSSMNLFINKFGMFTQIV